MKKNGAGGRRESTKRQREMKSSFIHTVGSNYIEDITRGREDMNFIFEWQNILRTSAASE